MKFTSEELGLELPCGECLGDVKMSPDVLCGHLAEAHEYTVAEIEKLIPELIQEAIEQLEKDEWAYQESKRDEPRDD